MRRGYRCVIERFYWEACKRCELDCPIRDELASFFEKQKEV